MLVCRLCLYITVWICEYISVRMCVGVTAACVLCRMVGGFVHKRACEQKKTKSVSYDTGRSWNGPCNTLISSSRLA